MSHSPLEVVHHILDEIEVIDFPAVILVDDKGHDFFDDILKGN